MMLSNIRKYEKLSSHNIFLIRCLQLFTLIIFIIINCSTLPILHLRCGSTLAINLESNADIEY